MIASQKILIVDDNPLNVEILEEVCSDYVCETASTGEEALVVAAMFQPDIVLLDIMMPDLTGYEVCQMMRKSPLLNHAKIIMVSAKGMIAERLEGYKAGADDYIVKPFDEDELLAKIKVYARLKSEEQVSKFKKDFVKLLLLEANTPLNNIKTPLRDLLDNRDLDPDKRQSLLRDIHDSVNDIERLFGEVGSLSELESGTWNNPFDSIDLCELVKESIGEILPQASTRDIQVDYTIPESAYSIVNREQILRVFHIILENAIKFSPRHSQVQVRISDDGAYHCVTVVDEGKGMEVPYLIGQSDGDNASDSMQPSMVHGPSLTIAQHIVKLHNGLIDIERKGGKGTSVSICLPIKLVG